VFFYRVYDEIFKNGGGRYALNAKKDENCNKKHGKNKGNKKWETIFKSVKKRGRKN
jgi:hypothetical protein